MKLLKEMHRKEGLRLDGRAIKRKAARAIIPNGFRLLMVYSKQNGDYKFPGGGIRWRESPEHALRREVQEECGAIVSGMVQPFGKVIEYDLPVEPGYDLFKMTSYYYWCQIDEALGRQRLDPYERELGFIPIWVEIDQAIERNSILLRNGTEQAPHWTRRELFVLEQVKIALEAGSG